MRSILSLVLIPLAACTTVDPLYCDEKRMCTDPARPFCDLAGEYPASNGVARTCIPSPDDDAGPDDGGDNGSSAGMDGGDQADAGVPNDAASPCVWSQFSRLANINTSQNEIVGSLGPDGLTIYFTRSGGGIFVARRDSVGEAFGPPTQIEELGEGKEFPEISSSGLEIFYRVISGGSIERATRDDPDGVFGDPEPTGLEGLSPSLSGDGLSLYFVGDRLVIQRATRAAIGEPWSAPVDVLPSGGNYGVDISSDERRLLITLNPFKTPKLPFLIAERNSLDEDFGPPVPLTDVLVPEAEFYGMTKWDGSETFMVGVVGVADQGGLYYSVCQ
jgi:hypothetical protein